MPKVSVVILNWNGKKFLNDCFLSLKKVRYKPLEVILVDQNSSDGSGQYVRKNFPWVKLIASKINNGFARGNNIGAAAATGEYILFLNNDTMVTPDFLGRLVTACMNDMMIGCIQPEMRVMHTPSLLDEAGAYLTCTGFLYHYGYRKSYRLPIYKTKREIFSAKGACMLIPKKVLAQIGGFDEEFFIFFEETDLCYRMWLAGYKVIYEPDAFIFHVAGGDTSNTYDRPRRIYLTFKNMNYSYLKNFGYFNLMTVYSIFVVLQMSLLCYFLFTGKFSLMRAMVAAYWWNITHMADIVDKRREVQGKIRKVSDQEINNHILHNPDIYYYYCLLYHAQKYEDKSIVH
ncbi:glycosyltransferase family 2 protein [Candidatus Gottesmanbacteria bacterium]|nr:glycosyltransferase family 2 protein [Candidatus Gottesmanbacteria bacterium]